MTKLGTRSWFCLSLMLVAIPLATADESLNDPSNDPMLTSDHPAILDVDLLKVADTWSQGMECALIAHDSLYLAGSQWNRGEGTSVWVWRVDREGNRLWETTIGTTHAPSGHHHAIGLQLREYGQRSRIHVVTSRDPYVSGKAREKHPVTDPYSGWVAGVDRNGSVTWKHIIRASDDAKNLAKDATEKEIEDVSVMIVSQVVEAAGGYCTPITSLRDGDDEVVHIYRHALTGGDSNRVAIIRSRATVP